MKKNRTFIKPLLIHCLNDSLLLYHEKSISEEMMTQNRIPRLFFFISGKYIIFDEGKGMDESMS
jgi:hypothetical protein